MSSRPPPPPPPLRNALQRYLARIAPPADTRRPGETFIRAVPQNPLMNMLDEHAPGVHDAIRGGTRAVRRALNKPGSPINALTQMMGDPLSSISGPGSAIAGFATRNVTNAHRFASPGFHNFIIKHGPKHGHFSAIRDWAPEGVIEDLWKQYTNLKAVEKAKFAARHAPATGTRTASRADSPRNALK